MSPAALSTLSLISAFALAQDGRPAQPDGPSPGERPAPGGAVIDQSDVPAKPPTRTRAELEEEFKDMLTGAALVGTWQMTSEAKDSGDQTLTPPRSETYTIQGATKISDEVWIVTARIQFAEKDVSIPVPVRVVWAEDTPMITLSDFPIPMLGTYSCRVIFHHGYYSGIWYSTVKNYGGIMSGRVVKQPSEPPAQPTAKENGEPEP